MQRWKLQQNARLMPLHSKPPPLDLIWRSIGWWYFKEINNLIKQANMGAYLLDKLWTGSWEWWKRQYFGRWWTTPRIVVIQRVLEIVDLSPTLVYPLHSLSYYNNVWIWVILVSAYKILSSLPLYFMLHLMWGTSLSSIIKCAYGSIYWTWSCIELVQAWLFHCASELDRDIHHDPKTSSACPIHSGAHTFQRGY